MLPKPSKQVSTKLIKCYFSTVHTDKGSPYGISNNQIRAKGIINSAGWFNSSGERLGKGDLTLKDMETISKSVYPDDLFIVLKEADSFHNLPADTDYLSPGRDYVMKNAVWVIGSGGVIIRVRGDIDKTEHAEQDGIKYARMSKKDFLTASKVDTAKKKIAIDDEDKTKPSPIPTKPSPSIIKMSPATVPLGGKAIPIGGKFLGGSLTPQPSVLKKASTKTAPIKTAKP